MPSVSQRNFTRICGRGIRLFTEAPFDVSLPQIRSRVYVTSGRYGDDGEWLARPDALTKAYNAVARAVKKAAPCTEVCCEGVNPLRRDEIFTRKVYISPDYRQLVQEERYAIG